MLKTAVCSCCGEDKKSLSREFYMSNSLTLKARKRMTICKDCIVSIYGDFARDYDSKTALYYTCRLMDVCFDESACDTSIIEAEERKSNVARMYFKNINSLSQYNKGRTFKDSDEFSFNLNNDKKKKQIHGVLDGNYEPSDEVIRIFGKNRSIDDLYYLEKEYLDWTSRFRKEEITKAIEVLIKRICNLNLIIDKKDLKGDDTTKEIKTLQELMKSSNLTPSQDVGSGDEDPFGVMIKIRENHKPVSKPDSDWEDVSGIKKYMNTWFFGHLAKMMGINNDLSKEYEEELQEYEVDLKEDKLEDGDI